MEDLLRLLPRTLVAAVVVPFVLGVATLALLVQPTATGQAFVFLLFVGGASLLVLLSLGLTLLLRQSRGIERQRGPEE